MDGKIKEIKLSEANVDFQSCGNKKYLLMFKKVNFKKGGFIYVFRVIDKKDKYKIDHYIKDKDLISFEEKLLEYGFAFDTVDLLLNS